MLKVEVLVLSHLQLQEKQIGTDNEKQFFSASTFLRCKLISMIEKTNLYYFFITFDCLRICQKSYW